jgi:hypothetical protein
MREQLIQYVNLLFAGAADCEDIKQEILQNTLDRYDDLIDQGKAPEAAYRLAIAGIGDVGELMGTQSPAPAAMEQSEKKARQSKMRAVAIGMYILSAIPLIALANVGDGILGLCLTLLLVAVATVLVILSSASQQKEPSKKGQEPPHPAYKAYKSISGAMTLAIYLAISFWSQAWHITWLVFLIAAAIDGIVRAVFDLKEAK